MGQNIFIFANIVQLRGDSFEYTLCNISANQKYDRASQLAIGREIIGMMPNHHVIAKIRLSGIPMENLVHIGVFVPK